MSKYMKTIVTAIVACVAIAAGVIVVAIGVGDGKLIGVLVVVISATVSSLVSLQENQQTRNKLHQVQQSTERIDRVVNHTDTEPHKENPEDSTVSKYSRENR